MKGFEVVKALKKHISDNDIVVSSNGNISREAFHFLPQPQVYLRGSMGLPLSVGLGLALANPNKRIIVITGDGNFLMGLGSTITTAFYHPKNLKILILDNNEYFTTGGQPTVSSIVNYTKFFTSINAENQWSKKAIYEQIEDDLTEFLDSETFSILHLQIEAAKEKLTNIPWHPKKIAEKIIARLIKTE
jgi:thiamine pyrophosphate-dependent acetolactate synthase large subunit-like protein